MTDPWVRAEGRWRRRSLATVPLADRAVRDGLSLFETVRVAGGIPLRLEAHRKRLARSLRDWRWPEPREWNRIAPLVAELIRRNRPGPEATLRITLTGGGEGAGWAPAPQMPSRLFLEMLPSRRPDLRVYRRGVAVVSLPPGSAEATGFSRWKVGSRAMQAWVRWREGRRGAFECLLLDARGGVVEGTRTNVACVRGRTILTPRLVAGGLPGTVRALLPRLAARRGYRWIERTRLTPRDLWVSDEVFLTNALIGVLPVIRVDGRRVGRGTPGACATALEAAIESGTRTPAPCVVKDGLIRWRS